MEHVYDKILSQVLGGSVTESSFPYGNTLDYANEKGADPSREQEDKEGGRLHVGKEGVVWVVDGVELVVDAVVLVLNI